MSFLKHQTIISTTKRFVTFSGKKYKAILFDVDSKDPSLGMSCPPRQFLEAEVLQNVLTCIGTTGVFILNLVCRDDALRDTAVETLRKSFKSVCAYKLDEDVNEIFYCRNDDDFALKKWQISLEASAKNLNYRMKETRKNVTGGGNSSITTELIEVQDFLNSLKI